MKHELSRKARKSLALLEDARTAIALFGGFSMVFLTIPVSKSPTVMDKFSLFMNASSSMLLLVCALLLAITSTIEKSNLDPGDEWQHSLGRVDPLGYKFIVGLVWISLSLFAISFLLVTFRVHWAAGLGSVCALLIASSLAYFISKKYD
jgi:hypothetical protein